ncbi:MAG: BamA/TamA family outer membrane protein [Acidobacteriota bacterium]|nr:BamA/TamA family outer membrane protein [Acidobacteriota bacterium]
MIAALAVAAALAMQAGGATQAPRTINDIRVHGNHATPDTIVLELAGVKAGDPIGDDTVKAIETRLRRSGRFDRVEVMARSRSLDGSDLSIVILIEEPAIVPLEMPGGAVVNTVRRIGAKPMFLPILDFSDYGFSYGARASFVDIAGKGSRFSFPFTWGANKRAAAEYEHRFGPDRRVRIEGAASWLRRDNPFYEIEETRRDASAGLSYAIARPLRVTARGGITDVSFGEDEDRFPWVAGELTLDTRIDPNLPRQAVYASVRAEHLAFDRYEPANRVRTDLRGYLGLLGQSVLAVRGLHIMSDTALPPFERALIGGASTVRGSDFGYGTGDNLAVGSVEVRVPLSSPLSIGRLGVSVFADVGAAYDRGLSLGDADYRWGYGAGAFFSATVFRFNLDVATDGKRGARVHAASGFRF